MKPLYLGLLLAVLSGLALRAQSPAGVGAGGNPFTPSISLDDASPAPSPDKKKDAAASPTPATPTTIDSQNMDYDEKTRVAVFTGDDYGVFLKDPQFTVNCNKLTAYMRKAGGDAPGAATAAPGAKGKSSPAAKGSPGAKASPGAKTSSGASKTAPGAKASPSAKSSPAPKSAAAKPATTGTSGADSKDPAAAKAGGLQRAVAEGDADHPVVIVQDKPATNGEQPQHNVGIALKADYNADTGDVILTGWPRVSQGINTQVATSSHTVMIMNKDGKTMTTHGPSKTVIQEQSQDSDKDKDKKSSKGSASPTPSPL